MIDQSYHRQFVILIPVIPVIPVISCSHGPEKVGDYRFGIYLIHYIWYFFRLRDDIKHPWERAALRKLFHVKSHSADEEDKHPSQGIDLSMYL